MRGCVRRVKFVRESVGEGAGVDRAGGHWIKGRGW